MGAARAPFRFCEFVVRGRVDEPGFGVLMGATALCKGAVFCELGCQLQTN